MKRPGHWVGIAAERYPSMRHAVNTAARALGRHRDQVLFGSRSGSHYTDNTPELFEWVLDEAPEVDPVWMAREALCRRLAGRDFPVARLDGAAGLVRPLRSRVGVVSVDLRDIARVWQLVPDAFRVLYLGHGIAAKRARLAMNDPARSKWWLRQLERWPMLVGAAAASSPFIADLASVANNIPRERFVITGYPRDDLLLDPSAGARTRFRKLVGSGAARAVLYAPSWRQGGTPTRFFPFDDRDLDGLRAFLESRDMVLLLRPHLKDLDGETGRELGEVADGRHLVLCTSREVANVNEVLPFVDALVSDYSSIFHDYLLLDRPILLVPYDAERFATDEGFAYDYHELRPGSAISSQAELIDALDIVARGRDLGRERRKRLTELVHTHRDGRARERLTDVLVALVGDADHLVGSDDGAWEAVSS